MNDQTHEDKVLLGVYKLEQRVSDLEAEVRRLKEELSDVANERDNYKWKLNKMDALDCDDYEEDK